MKRTTRTENRVKLIDTISEAITDKDDFDTLNYRTYNESRIKQSLNHFLVSAVKDYFSQKGYDKEQAKKAAYECVLWEGTPTKPIHNRMFLGCNHRPDFEIHIDDLKIAVEVKIGGDGNALRSGLGQALVYSQLYSFTIYLFIDISDDNAIAKACVEERYKPFIDDLWARYNVRFLVV